MSDKHFFHAVCDMVQWVGDGLSCIVTDVRSDCTGTVTVDTLHGCKVVHNSLQITERPDVQRYMGLAGYSIH